MKLDAVHDLQRVFREILAATASPGAIADLAREAELLDLDLPFNGGILLVALALLDAETSFALASEKCEAAGQAISQLTYAKAARVEEADFVFVFGQAEGSADAAGAIGRARSGTLVDPHLGATIVVEVESLDEGGGLELTGPGIESSARLGVRFRAGLGEAWIEARAAKNAEFPLGVDMILVDSSCRLAALPRTTRARMEG